MIAENKTRVAVTLPKDAAEAFKQDAQSLNLTLSSYAYLVLGGASMHLKAAQAELLSDTYNTLVAVSAGFPFDEMEE